MCQIKSEGGRRCAIHRHDSNAAIKIVVANSGLTQDQAEKLFSDLRREGRNRPTLVQDVQWRNALRNLSSAARTPVLREKVRGLVALATENSGAPDGATLYAMQRIVARGQEQAATLATVVETAAVKAGLNNAEAKEKFTAEYTAVDRKRQAEVPAEFTKEAVTKAKATGIPQDISTVVAVEKLKKAGEIGPRRITRTSVSERSSFLNDIGYDVDGGRLEVTFQAHPDRVVAYRNIPEEMWERMSGRGPGLVYSNEIRGNMDFQYPSATAAEEDANTVRCGSCGQFRASAHACPIRKVENELAAKGLSSKAVKALAVDSTVNVESITPRTVASIEKEIATVRADIAETNVEIERLETAIAARLEQNEAAEASEAEVIVKPVAKEKSGETVVPLETVNALVYASNFNKVAEYVPTAANQRNPVPYKIDDNKETVRASVNCIGMLVTTTSNYVRDITRRSSEAFASLSAADVKALDSGTVNDRFIIAFKGNRATTAEIVRQFNVQQYRAEVPYWFESEDEMQSFQLFPLGRAAIIEKHSRVEAEALRDAENLRLEQAIKDGQAVRVTTSSTFTRKYKVDGNQANNPRMQFAKGSELNAAFKNGKIAVFDINFQHERSRTRTDDQGYAYQPNHSYRETISGTVAVRKNADGVIEIVSKHNSLRCNCSQYRESYHCEHVDYVQRHVTNAAQQAIPAVRTHRLLTASLSGRGDVAVIENDKVKGTYISFGTEAPGLNSLGSNRGNRGNYYHQQHTMLPAGIVGGNDSYTPEQITQVTQLYRTLEHLNVVAAPPNSAGIRQALTRADVEIPIAASYPSNHWGGYNGGEVTGTMLLAKTREDVPTVKSHTLKCTCDEYQAKYDCEHVRATLSQPQVFTHINVRNWRPEDNQSVSEFARRNRSDIMNEINVVAAMQDNGLDREAAVIYIANEVERARVERERRDAERAERDRLYEIENRERLRAQRLRDEENARSRNERLMRENAHLKPDHDAFRASQRELWLEQDDKYSDNPEKFFEAHEQALARKAKGLEAIPYKMENVTDGICADTPGARKFGIELEFDIKRGENRAAALRKIGQELHAAGLTTTARQVGYHTAASNGWGSWSFEEDCTVDAELVSPILSDTPESWRQIAQVTEIIQRNGGYASTRCGSHVHVSTSSYGMSTAKHAELLRTMNQNEDTLFRLAANPATGKHRGTRWCAPNSNDGEDDIADDRLADHGVLSQYGHALALNFESAGYNEFAKRNVEFRMWDGTVDASAIQQQVKISAAITNYAEMNVEVNKKSEKPKEPREKIGHNRKREEEILAAAGVTKHTPETFKETNAGVASLLDKLFRKNEDKEGVAALFAVTNWQKPNRGD